MKVLNDYVYYNGQKLDFHTPENGDFKTLVYFHGGGIVEGDKNEERLINAVLKKGYGVISVNYSMYPNAKFPDYMIDAANAIKFACLNVQKYGGNGDIYVGGQSAGAYIAMMICSNHAYLENVGIDPLSIKGWFSDSAQLTDHFHYLEFEEHVNPWLQRISEHSPLYFINEGFKSSPIFLTAYTDDMHCRIEQNELFLKSVRLYSETTKISLTILEGSHCQSGWTNDENGELLFATLFDNFVKN